MPLFEFEGGQLVPAQVGRAVTEPIEPAVLDAVRAQALDLLQLPVLPVTWQDDDGARRLTAMDAAGQVVSVEVVERLDAVTLVDALARAGRTKERGWIEVAQSYPRGVGAFRRDWNSFREAQPAGAAASARVHILAAEVEEPVRPALDALAGAGVVVHELSVRAMSNGRLFLDVSEISVPVAPLPWLLPARPTAPGALDRGAAPQVAAAPVPAQAPPARATDAPAAPRTRRRAAAQAAPPAVAEAAREPALRAVAETAPEHAADPPAVDAPPPAGSEDLRAVCAVLDGPVTLVWAGGGPRREATLTPEGRIVVGDSSFAEPEAAAAALTGGSDRGDAWAAWRFGDHGPSLAEAREEVLVHRERAARQAAGQGVRRRRRRRAATD